MGRPGEPRKYDKEYKDYHSKPAQKKRRAKRNAANALVKKRAGASPTAKVKGKATSANTEVHHVKPLRSGGSNKKSNLLVVKAKTNRGWRKGKKGYG